MTRKSSLKSVFGIFRRQAKEACCESYYTKHTSILRRWKCTFYNRIAKLDTKLFFLAREKQLSRKTFKE